VDKLSAGVLSLEDDQAGEALGVGLNQLACQSHRSHPAHHRAGNVNERHAILATVANGADAVYLGTREFNARVNARNFSMEELDRALKYSHNRDVRG